MLEVLIYILLAIAALLVGLMVRQLSFALKYFKPPTHTSPLGQEVDLPSVTVCIPARNEQHALTDCLQRVIASTYEKLEIIVLDDVSGDDTSALIKSFASEGVRFVKGAPLPDDWLGKNHALQGLLQEASGTYLLFLDVDTRLEPQAIEKIVRYAISHNAGMVSVLPRRDDGWRASVLLSPLRYFWELIFHRGLSPASASNAWLIRRKMLTERFGGFEQFKNTIQPEAKLADALARTNEYRFLISTPLFGVNYEKKWRSQLVTSVRLLFPLLSGRTWFAFMALIELAALLTPFAVILVALVLPQQQISTIILTLSIVIASSEVILYAFYVKRVWKSGWFVGALMFPLILVQEAVLIITSVIQYKRKLVTWKGRVIRPEAQN